MKTLNTKPDGSITGVRKSAFGELPFSLVTNQPSNSIVVPANGTSPYVSFTVNQDGPINLTKFSIDSTGACLVKLSTFDGKDTIDICSSGIHSGTIFGSGAKPYPLPEVLYIDELRRIDASIQDISGAANTVRLNMQGYQSMYPVQDPDGEIRKDKEVKNRLVLPFFYTFDGGGFAMTALQAVSQAIEVHADHNFQLFQISGVSTGTFTLDIVNGNTGESLFNAPGDQHYQIDSGLVVGSANFPFRLHTPRLFKRNQKIIINMTDTSGVGNTVFLTLAGRACAYDLSGVTAK